MNYVKSLLSQELVQALGWTLLHSLWQGALVALALSVLLVFLNRQSAQVRYFISVTALFTTLALAVFTFFSIYREAAPTAEIQQTADTFSAANPTISASVVENSWFDRLWDTTFFSSYFEKHLPLIVTIWFMGLLVMALRMLGGLAYVQRLKHYQVHSLGARWQGKVDALRQQLGLRKEVKLLESLQVKVPMAIGYLKPVILVPVGAISGLSEKQVEAILAHELAHIYRHDYVFNLVQTLVETIFFYHPGMWWISATVRAERENCCDDIAINLCGDSLTFAGALAELEEMNYAAGPAMAMAFSGRKGSLLGRIKRLVSQPKRSASFTEGFLAACIVMVSLSMVSLSAMAKFGPEFEEFPSFIMSIPAPAEVTPPKTVTLENCEIKPEIRTPKVAVKSVKAPQVLPETGSIFASGDYELSVSVAPDGDGKDIIIVKDKKGRIQELYVDGKKVRKKDMPEFERIIEERGAFGGTGKKKKKEYASAEDVREAKEALSEVRPGRRPAPKVYVYNNPGVSAGTGSRYRYRYNYNAPEAPLPPQIDVNVKIPPIPPVRPVKPMKPMKPMRPMKPIAPRADDTEADRKDFEKEMKEYEKELKEWEDEMKEYESQHSNEWREFEKEMEEFGREMAKYGTEMAAYALKHNATASSGGRAMVIDERELRRDIEREAERRSESLERAAEERARAAEARAEAAKERAKAASIRAKAAEDRAKAAAARNERMEKLKAELRKDKLIGENDLNYTYKISNEGLYVNGKKQYDETFQKYKKLFHPGAGSNFNEVYVISEDGKSRTTTISNSSNSGKAKEKSKDEKVKAEKNKVKTKTDKK